MTPKWGNDVVAASFLVALEGSRMYSTFLPKVYDTKADADSPAHAGDIRSGEQLATGAVVIIAVAASLLTRSPAPLFVGAVTAAAMVGIYEWALWSGAR